MDYCKLREANGQADSPCDREGCVFWRLVDHIGGEERSGCAIQYFELLGQDNVAAWLLSVKDRVEGASVTLPAQESPAS